MELEDLESINKNDFLPLLPLNIKQELMDGGGGNVETGNICDSVEKKVSFFFCVCYTLEHLVYNITLHYMLELIKKNKKKLFELRSHLPYT